MAEENRSLTVPASIDHAEDETYQQNVRGRITALPFGLGFIILGGLLLADPQIDDFEMTFPLVVLIIVTSVVLTYLLRFFASGRRERGLFFLALLMVSLGGVLAALALMPETLPVGEWYPLSLAAFSVSILLTFLFERQHERGLLWLSLVLLFASAVALGVTLEIVPTDALETADDYFPLLIAFIGITLIPLAFRRSAG